MHKLTRQLYQQQQRKNRLRKWFILIMIVIFIFAIGFGIFSFFEKQEQQRQHLITQYPVRGLIIDQDDSYVDFTEANQRGIKYAYIRATQGANFTDDDFSDNYSRSIGSGLKIGVYHQFGFGSSVKDQEQNFVRSVGNNIGDLPIGIDISYYGDYNSENVNPKKLRTKIIEITSFLYHKYHRPILLKTSSDNYQILKNINHVQFSLDGNHNAKKVEFINLNKSDQIYDNGKSSDYQMSAFDGNKVKWEQYLKQLKNDDLEKSGLHD
ncbi:hypothetical protein BGL34_02550 [Fructilactobacillus lindneri]|nr:GH25 family lysozyme [Fructilactobacillus lindneri]ANZ57969.1 hypothetical protein AYR60_03985 [Fructilactobacillus lindneri]ANZ59239.1 hypothetical protein AYR59_03985 [Fructilactobacillus lindneri]POG98290.1 hypothetical protein BGL31_04310 [Fructilactobacillus lindneri]POH01593.1 hypothetical protein BGL32_03115 [Fructilactobacillus lindneri]POH03436.1 hypothetical protein BGL33_02000 [Fructilactobacillus lindneri]